MAVEGLARGARPGPNPRIRHRSREGFGRLVPAHVTISSGARRIRRFGGAPRARGRAILRARLRTWGLPARAYYSLQGNHAHLVVEADGPWNRASARGMKALGSRLARAVNRIFGRSGPVLAERYHVRLLRTPREVRNAIAYVLLNARRHAARARPRALACCPDRSGFVGRWFYGWRSSSAVAPDRPWPPPPSRCRGAGSSWWAGCVADFPLDGGGGAPSEVRGGLKSCDESRARNGARSFRFFSPFLLKPRSHGERLGLRSGSG